MYQICMRAIMAATILYSPFLGLVLLLPLVCNSPTRFYCRSYAVADWRVGVWKCVSSLSRVFKPGKPLARYILGVNMVTLVFIFHRVKTSLFVWMRNWTLVLVKPVVHHLLSGEEHGISHYVSNVHCVAVRHVYTRDELIALCPFRINTFDWRRTPYMRYRGTRAGRKVKMRQTLKAMDIPTIDHSLMKIFLVIVHPLLKELPTWVIWSTLNLVKKLRIIDI